MVRRTQLSGAQLYARPNEGWRRRALLPFKLPQPRHRRHRAHRLETCQFDEKSDYFDPKSTKDAPRWVAVDVEALVKFPVIPVSILRAQPELADMLILRRGNRLSITPVEKKDFLFIVEHLAKPQS